MSGIPSSGSRGELKPSSCQVGRDKAGAVAPAFFALGGAFDVDAVVEVPAKIGGCLVCRRVVTGYDKLQDAAVLCIAVHGIEKRVTQGFDILDRILQAVQCGYTPGEKEMRGMQ